MKKVFKTKGMHCKSCEMLVSDSVREVKGVRSVNADSKKNYLEVEFESPASEEEIRKAVQKEGYEVMA